jgi:hypothetical protein
MEFKILSIDPFYEYRAPNQKVAFYNVHYRTDKGFTSTVTIEQSGATKDSIAEAVRKDATLAHGLIGSTLK